MRWDVKWVIWDVKWDVKWVIAHIFFRLYILLQNAAKYNEECFYNLLFFFEATLWRAVEN